MSFSQMLWTSIEQIYGRILAHPFLRGLTDGSLPEEAFRHYAVQDALYLRDFARGLSLLGAKAPRDEWLLLFTEHARTAVLVERSLHDEFFRTWNLDSKAVYATPLAPDNLLYTSYLLRVAYDRPFHEGLAAFLPCYWIYAEVGKELEKRGSPNALYQKWIGTYASEEFALVVQQVIAVTDEVASHLGAEEHEAMKQHFLTSSRLEYLFWEMGYERKTWPL